MLESLSRETFFFCTLEGVDEVCLSSNNLAPCFRLSDKGTLPPRNRKCYFHNFMFEKIAVTLKDSVPFSGRIDKSHINSRMIKTSVPLSRLF